MASSNRRTTMHTLWALLQDFATGSAESYFTWKNSSYSDKGKEPGCELLSDHEP